MRYYQAGKKPPPHLTGDGPKNIPRDSIEINFLFKRCARSAGPTSFGSRRVDIESEINDVKKRVVFGWYFSIDFHNFLMDLGWI